MNTDHFSQKVSRKGIQRKIGKKLNSFRMTSVKMKTMIRLYFKQMIKETLRQLKQATSMR